MARLSAMDMMTPRQATKAAPAMMSSSSAPYAGPKPVNGSLSQPYEEPGETAAEDTAEQAVQRRSIQVPVGGELRIRGLKDGGVLVTGHDGNYNTVLETYAEDPSSIDLRTPGG